MFGSDSNVDNSTLFGKTQFLFLRSVISTLYCRHLATDAAIQLFSLQTAPSITSHSTMPSQQWTGGDADRFPVFTYALQMRQRTGADEHAGSIGHEKKLALSPYCRRSSIRNVESG
jgi:hypothetical protein